MTFTTTPAGDGRLSIEHKSHSECEIIPLRYNVISRWPILHNSPVPYKWIQWTVPIIRLHSSSLELLGTMADLKRGYERKGNFDRYRTGTELSLFSIRVRSLAHSCTVNERLPNERTLFEFHKSDDFAAR